MGRQAGNGDWVTVENTLLPMTGDVWKRIHFHQNNNPHKGTKHKGTKQ